MNVIFGWGEFIVKEYSSVELGIEESVLPKTQVQFRQEYFHLFYIPFFGTKKSWWVNDNGYWIKLGLPFLDNISYAYKNRSAPWYTYSGPLLILLVVLIFSLFNNISIIRDNTKSENELQNLSSKMERQLKIISNHHYIRLHTENHESYTYDIYLKVEEVNDKSVNCSIIIPDKQNGETNPRYVEQFYNENKGRLNTISLSKEKLQQAIPHSIHEKYNSTSNGIIIQQKMYTVEEISEHDSPLLVLGNPISLGSNGIFSFTFENQLDEASLISIENCKGTEFHWESKLPILIPACSLTKEGYEIKYQFSLTGTGYKEDTPYKFVLKLKDKKNKLYSYLVTGENFSVIIEQTD